MSIATPPGLMHACYQEEFPSKLLIQIRLQAEVARLCASFYRPKRKKVAHFLSRCTPLGSSDLHFGGRGKPSPAGKPALFFQADDGIRDTSVTGVQTCALPI